MRGDQRVTLTDSAGKSVVDHVEFGDQHVELERGDLRQQLLQAVAVDGTVREQVRLQSNGVQRHIAVAQRTQQSSQRLAPRRKPRALNSISYSLSKSRVSGSAAAVARNAIVR